MADVSIPREAVEAGVDAYESAFLFDDTAEMVEHILKAAGPLIEAAYAERKGTEIEHTASAFFSAGKRNKGSWFSHIGDQLRLDAQRLRRAAELRAQS